MGNLVLAVPNAPGPGAWVSAAALGPFPEGQLSNNAIAADVVSLETAAFATANIGKEIIEFAGAQPSKNVSQSNALANYNPTQLKPLVFAFVRPVRKAGPTAGVTLNLASSNLNPQGPTGPSGIQVQGTLNTDGDGGITAATGAIGIASVGIILLNGRNQIQIRFLLPFLNTNYSVIGNWFTTTVAPANFNPLDFNVAAGAPDGRTTLDLTFDPITIAGVYTDPAAHVQTFMIVCSGDQ